MWFCVKIDSERHNYFESNDHGIRVQFFEDFKLPTEFVGAFRATKIFSLVEPEIKLHDIPVTSIDFVSSENSASILNGILTEFDDEQQERTFFSIGSSSIVLINWSKGEFDGLVKRFDQVNLEHEHWGIDQYGKVDPADTSFNCDNCTSSTELSEMFAKLGDYSTLSLTKRAIIDEFVISIKLLSLKAKIFNEVDEIKLNRLIDDVFEKVDCLIFLKNIGPDIPISFSEYSEEDLNDTYINNVLTQQIIDRLIQINSAISYLGTQSVSGSLPILERRSLIRRNSLLGIGTAIRALNNVSNFIEKAFSKLPVSAIDQDSSRYKALPGTGTLQYLKSSEWENHSFEKTLGDRPDDEVFFKLNFFSARRGYRETEYTISAALQSLYEGATLKWSLMTITHEMLHGHVRYILAKLFYVDDQVKSSRIREELFKKFDKRIINKDSKDDDYLDSIRFVILSYCVWTQTLGSLTSKAISPDGTTYNIPENSSHLWNLLEQEYRNISEICVHVLDLHYFYFKQVEIYISLIWASWVEIPHVFGDLRQYILRSLISIASTINNDKEALRFKESMAVLTEIFDKYRSGVLNHPVVDKAIEYLESKEKKESLFMPFCASLAIVDLAKKVFLSNKVKEFLYDDQFVENEEGDGQDSAYNYNLPMGFSDEIIASPTAFLLDRMTKLLNLSKEDYDTIDFERMTASILVSLASNKKHE